MLQVVERGLITLDEPLTKTSARVHAAHPGDQSFRVWRTRNDAYGQDAFDSPHAADAHGPASYHGHPGTAVDGWRKTLPESSPHHYSKQGKRDITAGYLQPLIFPPGEPGKWNYGPSIDWAGKVVERINGEGLSLGQYMAKYIFELPGPGVNDIPPGQRSQVPRPPLRRDPSAWKMAALLSTRWS